MKIARLSLFRFSVAFRTAFRHAAATRSHAENAIVVAETTNGIPGYGEGCPRPYVTGETYDSVERFFHTHRQSMTAQIDDFESLIRWRNVHRAEINANPAGYAALELALLDAIAREAGVTIEALFGLPSALPVFRYTAVLGDNPWPIWFWQLKRYQCARFTDFKVKLSSTGGLSQIKVAALRRLQTQGCVRGDANNAWSDAEPCIAALSPLNFQWFALEEPVAAGRLEECRIVAQALETRIVLDESFLGAECLDRISADADRWILNCRVSKLGGLTRALELVLEARKRGLDIVVGAHVGETSILTRAGMTLAVGAGDALVAHEGGFGTHLLTADLVTPSLQFDRRGLLNPYDCISPLDSGLGIQVRGI